MKKEYKLRIEAKEIYSSINSLIQTENSDIKWTPDKKYSGFFVNEEFQLMETVGINPLYLNKVNHTVVSGKYKLDSGTITIEANFKLKNRNKLLWVFYSLTALLNLIGIFQTDKAILIIALPSLLLVPFFDKIISKRKLTIGITRFESNFIDKIKNSTANISS